MNKHSAFVMNVLGHALLSHNNHNVSINRGKHIRALEYLFQENGVEVKKFGLGSNIFKTLPRLKRT